MRDALAQKDAQIAALIDQNALLVSENAAQKLVIEKLTLDMAMLKRVLFGQKREATADLQDDLFNVESIEMPSLDGAPAPILKKNPSPATKQQPRRVAIPTSFPREERLIDLPESDKIIDGVPLKRIGEEVSEQLQYTPGNWTVLRTIRPKYVLPSQPDFGIKTAPAPPSVIEGGLLAESALAHVAVSKFCDHLPLNRQVEIARRSGLELSVSTLSENLLNVAMVWLKPLVAALWRELRTTTALHVDESILATLAPGQTKKTRIWTYLGKPHDRGPPITLYHYTENKAGIHVREVLQDWPRERTVYLQADAANNYDALYQQNPGIREVGCWAHARRKFFEIAKTATARIFAHDAVESINRLFAIERDFRESTDSDRSDKRRTAAQAVLDEIKTAFEDKLRTLAPKTPTARAIAYTLNHWEALGRYLEADHLVPDNNAAERALRKAAIGRKNSLTCSRLPVSAHHFQRRWCAGFAAVRRQRPWRPSRSDLTACWKPPKPTVSSPGNGSPIL